MLNVVLSASERHFHEHILTFRTCFSITKMSQQSDRFVLTVNAEDSQKVITYAKKEKLDFDVSFLY